MRVLGIDPSLQSTGFGVVDCVSGSYLPVVYGIIKILALGAVGVVVVGAVVSCVCDIFECREWKRGRGRTEVWRLMH